MKVVRCRLAHGTLVLVNGLALALPCLALLYWLRQHPRSIFEHPRSISQHSKSISEHASIPKPLSIPESLNLARIFSIKERFVQKFGPRQMSGRARKKVLMWSTFFGEQWADRARFEHCPVSNCEATEDRSQLPDSDALVFHPPDVDLKDLPSHRLSHQAYVLYNMENPCFTEANVFTLDGLINWTMSYRRDADVLATYGEVLRLSDQEKAGLDFSWKKKNRTKLVAWAVSNCKDLSGRKEMVKELEKYIRVDSFGKCGKAQLPEECGRYRADRICPHVLGQYKFYLALENNICRDYVTEKVWWAFLRQQVPVVMGGGVALDKLLPPNSYISLSQFPDVRALADHLLFLDAHPEEYNRYHAWREEYKAGDNPEWCSLCAALHDSSRPAQLYTQLGTWTHTEIPSCQCQPRNKE